MTLSPANSVGGGVAILSDTTLAAPAASIDTGAGAVTSGYLLARVVAILRTTAVAETSTFTMIVNDDTSALYDLQSTGILNVGGQSGLTLAGTSWLFGCPGASADAGTFGFTQVDFPGYDQSPYFKSGTGILTSPNENAGENYLLTLGLRYRSTSAVTRVKVAAGSGSFATGSRLAVLGIGA